MLIFRVVFILPDLLEHFIQGLNRFRAFLVIFFVSFFGFLLIIGLLLILSLFRLLFVLVRLLFGFNNLLFVLCLFGLHVALRLYNLFLVFYLFRLLVIL